MTTFKTQNRHGYSIKFSPNRSNLLAIATAQYYGFKGGGTLFLVSYNKKKSSITKKYDMFWEDGLFDVVWSRTVKSLLVTGSGDGTIQMWNYKHPQVIYIKN
jgi:peroxin-7